ncbi:3-hydroxybenzoate 6-monooxygenase [Kitasatospora sp. GP82]|uniref:3-hydroxybenzoate 6-monooxygenase n=1 Tax=Kitasatospora sp. GP82 TaxID=3035089 RepID=UPI002473A98F|nr:3-hydroxybenzoate 6-monooxygenase [Kitasatospora sp. GP82]MDH6123554.1 2-polyprenyl-6-methoxyphenol hydroxylase-like FAD-dependent oxidoreductase [Kitasatospora sp. GP82]
MAKIVIAGGGIGGLATALSISRRGHQVVVLEARDTFTEIGAGIQLGPNAFHALDRLGVGDEVRERAVFIDELRFMDGTTSEKVASMPLTGEYRTRFGNPYAVVHRIDIYEPLLNACRAASGVELRTDAKLTHYSQDAFGVTAHLASGDSVHGDALIGADGINSYVRKQLVGDGYPKASGHTIYRSVIPMEKVPEELRWNTVTLWAGPKWHFVHYPIGSGKYFNLAATRDDAATEAVVGKPVEKDFVLNEFPDLGEIPRQLLELGEDWKSWVLCDRDPVEKWTDGKVVLVGDAAHPMLQYAAQGACQALEDAVWLGDLIGAEPEDFEQRFEKFNSERRERTAATQLTAREMGRQLYHPIGEGAKERNAMLSAFTADELYDKVEWLHGAKAGLPLEGEGR